MTLVERVHAISYTLFLIQTLSDKWQLVAVVTPGLASDFEGDLSTDDVSFTAVLGVKHTFSERFALGGGLAYERSFGEPLPLPFVLVEWAIAPRLALNALLPINATLRYSPWQTLDVGIFGELGGNLYHGDPDKYGVGNPLLNYSVASAGAEARVHVTRWAHVTLKGGYAFHRRFEFSDGSDVAQSYDLIGHGTSRAGSSSACTAGHDRSQTGQTMHRRREDVSNSTKYPALSLLVLAMIFGVAPVAAMKAGLLPEGACTAWSAERQPRGDRPRGARRPKGRRSGIAGPLLDLAGGHPVVGVCAAL